MREIKFRVWSNVIGSFTDAFMFDASTGILKPATENCILMQFTGLKDKNGKEIYEGDIVGDSTFCYVVSCDGGCFTGLSNLDVHTVLGNVYENADLLTNK